MPEATVVARGLLESVRQAASPLTNTDDDYDPLLDLVGDAKFVLLGEASHGTREFYRARAEITQRLIREKGFTAVAVEADWLDAYRVNCFVRGAGQDASPGDALGDFRRFPTWMWRNTDVLEFVGWLRGHNDGLAHDHRVGFYGLDLYSLHGLTTPSTNAAPSHRSTRTLPERDASVRTLRLNAGSWVTLRVVRVCDQIWPSPIASCMTHYLRGIVSVPDSAGACPEVGRRTTNLLPRPSALST